MGAPDLIVPGTASGTAPVGGTGTTNYIPRWNPGPSTLGDSGLIDNGTAIYTTTRKIAVGSATAVSELTAVTGAVAPTANPPALQTLHGNDQNVFRAKYTSTNFNVSGNWLGLGFGYHDNYMKAAIIAEAKDNSGRASMHIALNAAGTAANVGLADARMTVTYDGNVGIGTASPLSLLHVRGSSASAVQAFIHNANGGASSAAELVFGTYSGAIPTGAGNPGPQAKISAINTNVATAQTDLAFYTYPSTGLGIVERMRINSAGTQAQSQVAIGTSSFTSGRALTTVADLDVFGVRVGRGPGDIASNTAVGAGTLSLCTTGSENTVLGQNAGFGIFTGARNVMIGVATGSGGIVTGSRNIVVGRQAGNQLTSGSDNILLGNQAGDSITTESSNIVIGSGADVAAAGDSNQLVLGDATNYVATNGGATTYYATAGASLGYIRVRLNGTFVKIQVFADV